MTREEIDELKLAEKKRLSEFPYFERDSGHVADGILLSDWIEYYCRPESRLVDPFAEDSLRPAGYDLRVGANYAVGGKVETLNVGGSFTIKPYQVAIIQTLETLNVPDFLIGRWNIRVKLAYSGLLWVGGAQVDPGFRGRLSCPIYNLSTRDFTLKYGDRVAMIDFVTTTPVKEGISKAFQWWNGKSLVFQEYPVDLQSGVEDRLKTQDGRLDTSETSTKKQLADSAASVAQDVKTIQSRIDTFLSVIFTVVAVLFAGLGIVATKGSDDSLLSSSVLIAAVALYFALRPYVIAFERNREDRRRIVQTAVASSGAHNIAEEMWYVSLQPKPSDVFVVALLVIVVLAAGLGYRIGGIPPSARDIRQANEKASLATDALDQEKRKVETEIQLRRQSDARLESLQQQVNLILQNQITKKK